MGCHQPIADTGDYAPGGEICWFCVNFPRDLKSQSLSSLTVEIAFKRRKQAIKYQCWCGVNFLRDLKCQILSSLTLEIAFKRRKEADIYFFYRSFRFKKSEQPQIVAFNRIVVNYNVHLLFYLVLTIVRQDTKICNGTTNDFSESCVWIFLLLWKREGKKTIRTSSVSL